MQEISIALIYDHDGYGPSSLLDYLNNDAPMLPEHVNSMGFIEARGRLKVFHDRFHCILDARESGELYWYAQFLAHSLTALSPRPLPKTMAARASRLSDFGENVIAREEQEDGSVILVEHESSTVYVSYLDPSGSAPEYRLSPYFRGLRVAKREWEAAAFEALDEYVGVLERLPGSLHPTLQQFRDELTQLKRTYVV